MKSTLISGLCGNPGYPQNGYRTGSVFTDGSTVYFYCSDSSHVLSGASSTTCQSNGAWSNPTPPRCKYRNLRENVFGLNDGVSAASCRLRIFAFEINVDIYIVVDAWQSIT